MWLIQCGYALDLVLLRATLPAQFSRVCRTRSAYNLHSRNEHTRIRE